MFIILQHGNYADFWFFQEPHRYSIEMRSLLYFVRQFGFDPIRLIRSCRYIPKFLFDLARFVTKSRSLNFVPAPTLLDFGCESGSANGHYFWQDLLAARWIFEAKPNKHLDVGSRVDGFVAHLLTFMKVDLLDVRPMTTNVEGLNIALGDAQQTLGRLVDLYDSVSSLHTIEHFGLGRYGDSIDPEGHVKGLLNISDTVSQDGKFIVSFPIGKPKVYFNSQRIVHPEWPLHILKDFDLIDFVLIPWVGEPVFGLNPSEVDLENVGQCGLYRFKRRSLSDKN